MPTTYTTPQTLSGGTLNDFIIEPGTAYPGPPADRQLLTCTGASTVSNGVIDGWGTSIAHFGTTGSLTVANVTVRDYGIDGSVGSGGGAYPIYAQCPDVALTNLTIGLKDPLVAANYALHFYTTDSAKSVIRFASTNLIDQTSGEWYFGVTKPIEYVRVTGGSKVGGKIRLGTGFTSSPHGELTIDGLVGGVTLGDVYLQLDGTWTSVSVNNSNLLRVTLGGGPLTNLTDLASWSNVTNVRINGTVLKGSFSEPPPSPPPGPVPVPVARRRARARCSGLYHWEGVDHDQVVPGGYEYDGMVIDARWEYLQPSGPGPIPTNCHPMVATRAAIAAGMDVKWRLRGGAFAPAWVKAALVAMPGYFNPAANTSATIGVWWDGTVDPLYADLLDEIDIVLAGLPEVLCLTAGMTTTFWSEPGLRQLSHAPNRDLLRGAAIPNTIELERAAFAAMAALHRDHLTCGVRSVLEMNPWQYATGSVGATSEVRSAASTLWAADLWLSTLGRHGVLGTTSLTYDAAAYPSYPLVGSKSPAAIYEAYFKLLTQRGVSESECEVESLIGSGWYAAIEAAAGRGDTMAETMPGVFVGSTPGVDYLTAAQVTTLRGLLSANVG